MAVDTQKLLASPVAKKGGGLKSLPPINKSFSIVTKVVQAKDILKGTLAAKKVEEKKEKKRAEQLKRKAKEQEIETPENKDTKNAKKLGIRLPQMSWLDGVKNFIFTTLFGWAAIRLLDNLPGMVELLRPLQSVWAFLEGFGKFILTTLINVIDAGYKAYDWTRGQVVDKFGEGAGEKFDKFMGVLNLVMNGVIALGIAASAMGGGPRGPRRGPKNQLKRNLKKIKRPFDPKRAQKLKRVKNIKEIAKQRRIAENAAKRQRLLRRIRPTNVRRTAQVALERTGRFFQGKPKPGPGLFGRLKSGAGQLWQGTKSAAQTGWNFTSKQGQRFGNWANKSWKGFAQNLDDIVTGITAKAATWQKQVGNILDMAKNPAKLIEKVKGVLKGQLDDILKNNKVISKLKNLNPKDAAQNIRKLLKNARKSKGLMQLRNGLKGAQKMKIGGVDKVIAAIMGLIDYTVFGESPINAILRALGGLLGYTAGFAIGAPFGGAPGFITGMAGAWVGEKASQLIAKALSKTALGNIDDPIMNDGRKLVRDPDRTDVEISEPELPEGTTTTPINVSKVQKNKNNEINNVSKSASYEDGSSNEVVVEDGGTGAGTQSGDGELMVAGGGGGTGGSGDTESLDLFYKNSG